MLQTFLSTILKLKNPGQASLLYFNKIVSESETNCTQTHFTLKNFGRLYNGIT